MIILLCVVILALAVVIIYQWTAGRKRTKEIARIIENVEQIRQLQTKENVLCVTADHTVKRLLVLLNNLLDDSRNRAVSYWRREEAMRKMLSNISHDLKTPLTVMLGYSEILNENKAMEQKEQQRLLQHIHRKTEEVLKLIDAFFDLAKLESGDKQLSLAPVQMNEVCRRSMLSFYDVITAQGLDVDIQIPDQPLYARADEEALDRILSNLLSNALKYGRDGGMLGLLLREEDDHIAVEVWDRGKGIHEQDQDRVFERMYTLDDSRNKQYAGSGLGLTITKRLVENCGGTIGLTSIPYVRTCFWFRLSRVKYGDGHAAPSIELKNYVRIE